MRILNTVVTVYVTIFVEANFDAGIGLDVVIDFSSVFLFTSTVFHNRLDTAFFHPVTVASLRVLVTLVSPGYICLDGISTTWVMFGCVRFR
jgi:hypothetical protein